MTMTMDELMKVLDMQEDILQFTHFTNADAWELGTMILMEARRRGAQVGIMIRRSNGEVVFQYCDNGITPHNVELMRRKSNSVLLTERSSLQLYMAATNAPESVKQMVLDPKEYAMLGGGFPPEGRLHPPPARCSSVRNCSEQAAGVVFLRVEKDIVHTAGFHNRPMIHDDDPVTERTDDAEVV